MPSASASVSSTLWLDGRDLRPLPLTKRKAHLNAVLAYETAEVFKTMVVEEHGFALFEAVKRLDLEGIVAKRKADTYGPASVWYKVMNPGTRRRRGGAICSTDAAKRLFVRGCGSRSVSALTRLVPSRSVALLLRYGH